MEKLDNKKTRENISNEYKWDIESMYSNEENWQKDFNEINDLLDEIYNYKGIISKSSENLLRALELKDKINRKAEHLFVYSKMKKDEDNTIAKYQALYDKAIGLSVKIQSTLSFVVPEILTINEDTIKDFIESNEGLKAYKFYLNELLRQKEHVLNESEERILAMGGEVALASKNIFTMINNADIKFPKITDENGDSIELTKGNFIKFLESKERRVRKEAFEGLYESYGKLKNTLSATLISSVKKDVFYSKVRKYNSALEASLDDDNIPVSVYENLINVVNKRLDLMHRYVDIRKKVLGVDELHMYDLYTPLVKESKEDIDFDRAKEMVLEGLSPLGKDYMNDVNKAFSERWIDVYETKGKTSGGYSWGSYDSKPFILLNYHGTINDVFTLAHELGHSMHTYYANNKQPYIYAGYKIFVAEVASTVNEAILMDHLINKSSNKTEKLYLLNHFLEQFRGTVYRQTMFAEFEKEIHDLQERGEALTTDSLSEYYYSLNKKYYGENIHIDDEIKYEWARIPHFYNAFYVYKYATGYSSAISISQRILKGEGKDIENYINFLSSGGSDYPLNILKKAGVDMTNTKPIEDALDVFEDLLDQVEKLI